VVSERPRWRGTTPICTGPSMTGSRNSRRPPKRR
jgi:hypothetical protein